MPYILDMHVYYYARLLMIRSWWAAEKSNSEPVPGLAEAILVFGIWVPLLGADEKSEVLQGVHRMTMYIRVYIYIYIFHM